MKYLFTFLALVFITTALWAQKDMSESIYKALTDYESDNKLASFEKYEKTRDIANLLPINHTRETIWVNDSSLSYDTYGGTEWILTEREKALLRDPYGNTTNGISQFFYEATDTWANKDTISATYYTPQNALHKTLEKPWNSNTQQWADTSNFREYNEDGKWLVLYDRNWSYNDNKFNSGRKSYMTLDDNGNYLYHIDYTWNTENQEWYLNKKWNYSCDDNGNIMESLVQKWNSETEEWENARQIFYSYDDNGNQIQRLGQIWDSETEEWENYWQWLYNYDDNGNQTQWIYQTWNSGAQEWESDWQGLSSYDDDGNLTKDINQFWNSETEGWENDIQGMYSYDDNGNLTQLLMQTWNSQAEEWKDLWKDDYFWSEFECFMDINDLNQMPFTIYPNPASNKIIISTDDYYIVKNINIYTTSGRLIETVINKSNVIDLGKLTIGSYLLLIETDKGSYTEKIIKQ